MTINEYLDTIEKYIPEAKKTNEKVSNATVGWQLDHSLKVINSIALSLLHSKPQDYQPKTSLLKSIILFTGYIPRGKAKAPKLVNNKEEISKTDIEKQLKKAHQLLSQVKQLPSNSFFTHHMFGDLNLKTALKFMEIHTNHHIKIIKDILK